MGIGRCVALAACGIAAACSSQSGIEAGQAQGPRPRRTAEQVQGMPPTAAELAKDDRSYNLGITLRRDGQASGETRRFTARSRRTWPPG